MPQVSNSTSPSLRSHASLNLRGILLPFTTPFKQNEEFDAEGLRANLRRWNATGVAGYVALGSTGERVNVNEREYLQIIECARDVVPKTLSFIVGAGQESRRGTITEIKRAAQAGADAVLVITPHFYRAAITQRALVDHYQAIADASPIPLLLYSMPDLTGIRIEPETAAELSQHPNIIGIKDSSADVARLRQTIQLSPAGFAVLTGNGTVLYEALRAGACGGILAVGCVATICCLEIFRLVGAENYEQALVLQEKLTPLALAVTKRYGIGGLKASLNILGLAGGAARLPLEPPSTAAQDEIASLLDAVHGAMPLKA